MIRKKREEREQEIAAIALEKNRRQEIIEKQFYDWNNGSKVQLLHIQNALKSFVDSGMQFAEPVNFKEENEKAVCLADYLEVSKCCYVCKFNVMFSSVIIG